jgi:hypothetical protein
MNLLYFVDLRKETGYKENLVCIYCYSQIKKNNKIFVFTNTRWTGIQSHLLLLLKNLFQLVAFAMLGHNGAYPFGLAIENAL